MLLIHTERRGSLLFFKSLGCVANNFISFSRTWSFVFWRKLRAIYNSHSKLLYRVTSCLYTIGRCRYYFQTLDSYFQSQLWRHLRWKSLVGGSRFIFLYLFPFALSIGDVFWQNSSETSFEFTERYLHWTEPTTTDLTIKFKDLVNQLFFEEGVVVTPYRVTNWPMGQRIHIIREF